MVEVVDGDLQGREDFTRPGVEVGRLTPTHADGGTAVEMDVSEQLQNVQSTVATVRFRLEPPGVADGQRSFVNIATMETGSDENKPQLLISLPEANRPPTAAGRPCRRRPS